MGTEIYLLADAVVWIEIAMLVFMAVFLAIVMRVLLARPGRYRDESRIPLDDQSILTGAGGATDQSGPHREETQS